MERWFMWYPLNRFESIGSVYLQVIQTTYHRYISTLPDFHLQLTDSISCIQIHLHVDTHWLITILCKMPISQLFYFTTTWITFRINKLRYFHIQHMHVYLYLWTYLWYVFVHKLFTQLCWIKLWHYKNYLSGSKVKHNEHLNIHRNEMNICDVYCI